MAVIGCIVVLLGGAAATYTTDFSSAPSGWSLETDCGHCSNHGGDECTRFTTDAIEWGQPGAAIHTRNISKDSCGAIETSGHMQWNTAVKYGTFTTKARWFIQDDPSASGFIGLFADGHGDSITFIFHGKGWDSSHDWTTTYQCECYQGGQGKNKKTLPTYADVRKEQEYQLEWLPDSVTWKVNGKVVRTETDKDKIPQNPMNLRLHTRSGYVTRMTKNFSAHMLSFTYQPVATVVV